MLCKTCGKEFEPCKEDRRIVFCSLECRIKFRNDSGYMNNYYLKNKKRWDDVQSTQEYKDNKNEVRRKKYAEDEKYRESIKEKVKKYNASHPHIKHAQRISVYGLTPDDYIEILEKQNNVCAICGCEEQNAKHRSRFYIDHNHTTGKVRGLLCNNCNFAIGHLKDSIALLENAIKYLEENDG